MPRKVLRFQIARDYFAIQGTSVASERTFSSSGLTNSDQRRKLTPESFGAIQMAKGHLKRQRARDSEQAERVKLKGERDAKALADVKAEAVKRAIETGIYVAVK